MMHGQKNIKSYLTNLLKLWHMLMIWLLWEDDYKMLKYLHHWSNKKIRWDYKFKKNQNL